ncbi:hypothetical protein GCM10028791_36740 [Echinicola sediminis]
MAHVTVDWQELGSKFIKVYPRNACGEGLVFEKSISVNESPSKPAEIEGPNRVGLTEELYSVSAVDGINYQWETEGGDIVEGQGSNQVRVQWEKEGDFKLRVTPMNACDEGESQEMDINVNLITDLREEEREKVIKVYPNPSDGDIHITVSGVPAIEEIVITNAYGQILRKFSPNSGIFTFDIQQLPKGLVMVIVKTKAGETVEKVWIR